MLPELRDKEVVIRMTTDRKEFLIAMWRSKELLKSDKELTKIQRLVIRDIMNRAMMDLPKK